MFRNGRLYLDSTKLSTAKLPILGLLGLQFESSNSKGPIQASNCLVASPLKVHGEPFNGIHDTAYQLESQKREREK